MQIICRSLDGKQVMVEAKRLIKAYGFRVTPNDPLEFSSARVESVSPDSCDMRCGEIRASDAPVWIVGGGKTAMDTAHALITECPGREVNLVAGSGTFFLSRDRLLPVGARRWLRGTPVSNLARESARRFDGSNEQEVASWLRSQYGVWSTPETGNLMFGVLSESENTRIGAGLNDVVMDYLVDIVDRGAATELVFHSGATKTITPGSWIVNCTGYVLKTDYPYEPYVSDGGAVVSIQARSATMHLTSLMAYFHTHVLFLGKIRDVPLYELDAHDIRSKAPAAAPYALLSLLQHNTSLITDIVPTKVFVDCGINLDRWYPLPRRMVATAGFIRAHRREREHCRGALDTLRERFDVRCGPVI